MTFNYLLIRRNLNALRKRQDISQDAIAYKLGISQNAYSKYELGQTRITLDFLAMISDYYGMELTDLLHYLINPAKPLL